MNRLNMTSIVVMVMSAIVGPIQAHASVAGVPVPEPLSLALLATGIAGLGAAEVIRRRKNK